MVVLRQKVCFVGDGTVGKSCIVQMATSGGVKFTHKYLMTLGIDLSVHEVRVGPDIIVELYIYDVSGQDVFRKTVDGYIDGLDWFVACYDITSKTTFENTARWIDMCRRHNKNARGVVCANKIDLHDKSETSEAQGEAVARAHNATFMQVSALRNNGTSELLKHIADTTAQQYEAFIAQESRR